jgi:hypothetical protein
MSIAAVILLATQGHSSGISSDLYRLDQQEQDCISQEAKLEDNDNSP